MWPIYVGTPDLIIETLLSFSLFHYVLWLIKLKDQIQNRRN